MKYILAKIERQLHNQIVDVEDSEITVERILPENPNDDWGDFDEAVARENVFRLGNMILLEKNLNDAAANLGFQEKRPIYRKSNITGTKALADAQAWDPNSIVQRQRRMANAAKTVWSVGRLAG